VAGVEEYAALEAIVFGGEFSSEATAEFTTVFGNNNNPNQTVVYMDNLVENLNFIPLTITYYDNYDWLDGKLGAFEYEISLCGSSSK
jgi:hypothetical protein